MSGKLTNIVDGVLSKPRSPLPYVPKPAFRPSMLGSKCLRKLFYSYNNVKTDYEFPLENKRKMMLGDAIHESVTDCFRKAGILIDYVQKNGKYKVSKYTGKFDLEFPVKDKDLELSAKIDAMVVIDGKLWIVEIKSINDKGFKALKKPKPEHLIQGIMYYYCFNRALAEGAYNHIPAVAQFKQAEGVIFYYMDKDNSNHVDFDVQGGSEIFTEVLNKMATVKEHTRNQTLPPTAYDWCKTCVYRKKCVQSKLK